MSNHIRITLEPPEYSALIQLSGQESRTPAGHEFEIPQTSYLNDVGDLNYLPTELREIAELLAAYGRKIRMAVDEMDEKHKSGRHP